MTNESEDVFAWECAPTTFSRAALAWCAAVECVAHPIYPAELRRLIQEHYRWEGAEPENYEQLAELHEEAIRRTEWLPAGADPHFVPPRVPDFFAYHDRPWLCLAWCTSVETLLIRTESGWVVRLVDEHAQRREAAEAVLSPGDVETA